MKKFLINLGLIELVDADDESLTIDVIMSSGSTKTFKASEKGKFDSFISDIRTSGNYAVVDIKDEEE